MKTVKKYAAYTKIHLKPEISKCPHCHAPLKFRHWSVEKYVITLDGVLRIKSEAHGCSDPSCLLTYGPGNYQSTQVHKYALPNSTYGLDILAYIGFQRSKNYQNFQQIHADLIKRDIQISLRQVDYLYQNFEYMLKCSLPQRIEQLKPVFAQNKGIILSIDGLQPQIGNDLLFVLRDVTSREVLHAELVHHTDTETMVRLFKIIKDSEIMVKGIVSDAQHSIRKAKDVVFPNIPYQLCTYHYLKDLGKPVGEADRALRNELKKSSVVCAQ